MVAEQVDTVLPPFSPVQPHVHGPLPMTGVAVPALHRLLVGRVSTGAVLLALPHTPLTGGGLVSNAPMSTVPPLTRAKPAPR